MSESDKTSTSTVSKEPASSKAPKKKKAELSFSKIFLKVMLVLLLIVLAIGMLFWGQTNGSTDGQGGQITFGSFDGQPIDNTPDSYFTERVDYYNYLMSMQNQKNTNVEMLAYQIYSYAFNDSVIHIAAVKEATKAGMTISGTKLASILRVRGEFQENGAFSPKKYSEWSDTRRKDLNKIVNRITEDEISRKYLNDFASVKSSPKEADFIKAMPSVERFIEYAVFKFSGYPDSEVFGFAKSKPEIFRKMKMSRITVESEAEAKTVLKELNEGKKTFEEAAKIYSKDNFAQSGGIEGAKWYFDFLSETEKADDANAVFGLAKDARSTAIITKNGKWILVKCDEAASPADFTVPDNLGAARTWMNANEKGTIEKFMLAKAESFRAEAIKDFDAACRKNGIVKAKSESFPLNYGDLSLFKTVNPKQVPELNGASTNKEFLKTVFSLKIGEIAPPIALNDLVLVYKIAGETAPDAPTLASIPERFGILAENAVQTEVSTVIMASPLLKNQFSEQFFKIFLSGKQ